MIAELDLRPGEVVTRTVGANRSQGRRAVGGKVHVTNQRVAFVPHGFDKSLGGELWEVPLGQVVSIDVGPRGKNWFDGSIRRRLRIITSTSTEYFVVNRVAAVASELSVLVGSASSEIASI
jgi:hypothetical protein